jgi:phage terminase large subunit-like protein
MSSPYFFDQRVADAAVDFFPRFLTLTTAEWARRPFHLAAHQAHHIRQIFGWRRRSDGTRKYRRVRWWEPKKGGKTELTAGVGHLLTIGDGEPTAEVYNYATDKNQAHILFERATRMVSMSPALAQHYEVTKSGLFCSALMSSFKPLSGDPTGKQGPAAHGALGDEVHEWANGDLHRFLCDGMANRRQPLDWLISTAGKVRTYADEVYQDSKAVLEDPALDPECYVVIYAADPDDDWTSPDVWAKANPNFPISPKREFLESQCRLAMRSPRLENNFRRFHLDQWVEQEKRWLPMRSWPANTVDPTDPVLWKRLEQELKGRAARGGLDLASISDINAEVLVFPPDESFNRWGLLPRFWVPELTVPERDAPRTPYSKWVREGALLETPGNVTDYEFIVRSVLRDAETFDLKGEPGDDGEERPSVALDRWNASDVSVRLGNEGIKVALFGQGYASMSGPSKELERLFLAGRFEHGNHPVLKWMFGNAATRTDAAANIKPDKERAAEKIDGVTATVMGLALCGVKPEEEKSEGLVMVLGG